MPLEPSADDVERLRAALPELPGARIARFRDELGLAAHDAVDLNATPAIAAYFEDVVAAGRRSKGGLRLGAKPARSGREPCRPPGSPS